MQRIVRVKHVTLAATIVESAEHRSCVCLSVCLSACPVFNEAPAAQQQTRVLRRRNPSAASVWFQLSARGPIHCFFYHTRRFSGRLIKFSTCLINFKKHYSYFRMNSLITDDQVYVVFILLIICNLVTGMISQTNQLADSQLVDKDNSHKKRHGPDHTLADKIQGVIRCNKKLSYRRGTA